MKIIFNLDHNLIKYLLDMDERDFFDEKEARKPHTLNCPHCHQSNEYELAWLVRTKKKQLSGRADERDRAKFAKARSYMVRRDDLVMCKNLRCRKRFEVAGVQSVAFADEPVQSTVADRAARISGSFSPRPK